MSMRIANANLFQYSPATKTMADNTATISDPFILLKVNHT